MKTHSKVLKCGSKFLDHPNLPYILKSQLVGFGWSNFEVAKYAPNFEVFWALKFALHPSVQNCSHLGVLLNEAIEVVCGVFALTLDVLLVVLANKPPIGRTWKQAKLMGAFWSQSFLPTQVVLLANGRKWFLFTAPQHFITIVTD